ncbi:MAG TPA: hypothetical protein VKA95_17940 [Nitrososphaeraceae archaeon]|nr:hypothetical protein [Nitrososphaeraceae archaeon]
MSTADFYKSGEGPTTQPASRNLEEITARELTTTFGASPSREKLRVTRFPVSIEEFSRLKLDVESAQPMAARGVEEGLVQEDKGAGMRAAEIEEEELPEMGMLAGEALAPAFVISFPGIQQSAFRPPDCTVGTGPNDVVVGVNTTMAIYSKTGGLRRTMGFDTLFRPVIPTGARIFDPKIIYDHYRQRWIIIIDSTRASPQGSWILVAASQTSDPSGLYWLWALDARQDGSTVTSNWADFSQLGFDTQAVYITNNMFQFNGGFQYVKLRILNKSELYTGSAVRWYDFWNLKNPDNTMAFTVQPAVHYTGIGGNPPAYLVNALWPGGNTLTVWTLTNPLGHWGIGGSVSLSRRSINCLRYDLAPDGEQKDSTTSRIETNDTRLLNAVYQHSATGERRLWTCHTTRHTWSGDTKSVSVVQWYEIDIINNNVVQQQKYGATGMYYFFPAIQTNVNRDAFIVFGRSSPSIYGELRQTGRRATAAPGTLEGSAFIKVGESAYTGARWGDYFGICRDPSNPSSVWMNGEYAESGNTWGTWTYSAKY